MQSFQHSIQRTLHAFNNEHVKTPSNIHPETLIILTPRNVSPTTPATFTSP